MTQTQDPHDIRPRLHGLIALTISGGIGLVGLYIVFVRLPIGQRWDDRALLGGLLASDEARRVLTSALHGIRISTLILMVALLIVIGLIRHRIATAILVAMAFGASIASAEVLKFVLPRRDLAPELNAYVDNGNIDTYPSGHATIAMAFALALIVVSSPRYRTAVAAFGMVWAATVPMMALAAGWHRPSDVLGGMALALMWLGGATALSVSRFGSVGRAPDSSRLTAWIGVGALVMCAVGLGAWISLGTASNVPVGGGFAAFVIAEIAIALAAVATVGGFAYLVRGVTFDRQRVDHGGDAKGPPLA